METTRLQDDLLQEYKAEKKLINEQLHLLDPLAVALRKPAAQRLLNKGILITCEFFCYLAGLGAIAFAIFMDKLPPFELINTLRYKADYADKIGRWNIENLYSATLGLVILVAALFLIMARSARQFRLKNNILGLAATHVKDLMGQQLGRKAAIDAIDQRHFQELPTPSITPRTNRLNSIPNPGYSE